MDRAEKERIVAALHQILEDAALVIVTRHTGMTTAEASDLRRRMREAGATFRVTKNRLARLAIADTPYSALASLFTGPTAIAYSDDLFAAAKVAVDFAARSGKIVILGGALRETMLDAKGVEALANMPSLDELRGKLVGLLQGPVVRLVGVLGAPAGHLAWVLGAYAGQGEEAA
ncbi:MAG: 50S ribosomal protein L10 [Alphaproteobacteria bacterium]